LLAFRRLSDALTCTLVLVTALPVPFDTKGKPNAMVHKAHFAS